MDTNANENVKTVLSAIVSEMFAIIFFAFLAIIDNFCAESWNTQP